MRIGSMFIAGILALAVLPFGAAHGPWTHCGATDVTIAARDIDQERTFYLVLDPNVDPLENLGADAIWIYEENNGILDLQRGAFPDTCDEASAQQVLPDLAIF